jgi:hypothetical protein
MLPQQTINKDTSRQLKLHLFDTQLFPTAQKFKLLSSTIGYSDFLTSPLNSDYTFAIIHPTSQEQ